MKTTVILDGPGTVLYERRRRANDDVLPVGISNYTYEKQKAIPIPTRGATAEEVAKYGKAKEVAKYGKAKEVAKYGKAKDADLMSSAQEMMVSLNARLKVCKTPEEQKALSAKIKRLQAGLSKVGAPAYDAVRASDVLPVGDDFKESDHPRAGNGQFGSGSGEKKGEGGSGEKKGEGGSGEKKGEGGSGVKAKVAKNEAALVKHFEKKSAKLRASMQELEGNWPTEPIGGAEERAEKDLARLERRQMELRRDAAYNGVHLDADTGKASASSRPVPESAEEADAQVAEAEKAYKKTHPRGGGGDSKEYAELRAAKGRRAEFAADAKDVKPV